MNDEIEAPYVDQLVYLNWVRINEPPKDVWLNLLEDGIEHPDSHPRSCLSFHLYHVGNVLTGDGAIVPVFVDTLSECHVLTDLIHQHRRSAGRHWSSIKSIHKLFGKYK